MTFQPILPTTGYVGWTFLQRTLETQQETFAKSPTVSRDVEYFRENIAKADTAEKLVGDSRLMKVALGAYGLDDDLYAKAFIRKVLDEGTLDPKAFANRLSDRRYKDLALQFGYGDLGSRTGLPNFAEKVIARFETRQFERAVGDQDPAMRQALGLETALSDIVAGSTSDRARWFSLMGNKPARTLMESALGLPSSFAALDLDQQLDGFRDRAKAVFGTSEIGKIAGEENREKAIRLFLIRNEAQASGGLNSGSVALSLLRSAPSLYG